MHPDFHRSYYDGGGGGGISLRDMSRQSLSKSDDLEASLPNGDDLESRVSLDTSYFGQEQSPDKERGAVVAVVAPVEEADGDFEEAAAAVRR